MKKKMLVIPGPFVPYNDVNTLINYKRLSRLDLSFDVVAIGGKEDITILSELATDNNYKKFNIARILDYKKMDIVRNPLNIFYFIFSYFRYLNEVLKLVEKNNYDFIWTSSLPGMSHIIGYKVKKKIPNIKWFAAFSDPIKGSPYKGDLATKGKNLLYKIAFKIGTFFYVGDFYEEIAVNNAEKLIFICSEQRDYTLSQYKNYEELKNKSLIMPLTIEPKWQMYKNLLKTNNNVNKPLIACHLGRVYGLRKIDNFLIALKELKEENLISSNEVIFNQYDETDRETLNLIKEYDLEDIFKVNERVSYEDSIRIMKESDILLLFDTLMPMSEIQPYLPSKIVEYLVLRKPILGICDKNSPSYRILKEYKHDCVGTKVDDIKANILFLINNKVDPCYKLDSLFAENQIMELEREINE